MAGVPAVFAGDGRGPPAAADRRAAAPLRDPAGRPPRGRDRRAAAPGRRGAPRRSRSAATRSTPAGRFGSNLVARSEDPEALAAAMDALQAHGGRARGAPEALPARRPCHAGAGAAIVRDQPARKECPPAMHGLDLVNTAIFVGAALVLLGIFSSLIATRAGAPLLLVFLVVGMLAGQDGPGGIVFNDYSRHLPRRHDRALDHPLRRRPQHPALGLPRRARAVAAPRHRRRHHHRGGGGRRGLAGARPRSHRARSCSARSSPRPTRRRSSSCSAPAACACSTGSARRSRSSPAPTTRSRSSSSSS